jgi:glycosyltransferase involved in cell wall biosynthesis
MVEDGRTGFVVPPRNEGALAEAVTRLLMDERLRREFGRNGRRKLETECSAEIVAEKSLAIYANALRLREKHPAAPALHRGRKRA